MSDGGDDAISIEDIIAPTASPRKRADPRTRDEKESWTVEHKRAMALLERTSLSQDIDERKRFANKIFYLMCFWLVGVMAMLALSGGRTRGFELAEKVQLMLIGSTTVNIIGLFAIVANYLFPKRSMPKSGITRKT